MTAMNTKTTPPIPPPGEREDYICKLSQAQPGLWIIPHSHSESFQAELSSGLTDEAAMEKLGGVLYARGEQTPLHDPKSL